MWYLGYCDNTGVRRRLRCLHRRRRRTKDQHWAITQKPFRVLLLFRLKKTRTDERWLSLRGVLVQLNSVFMLVGTSPVFAFVCSSIYRYWSIKNNIMYRTFLIVIWGAIRKKTFQLVCILIFYHCYRLNKVIIFVHWAAII